VRAQRELHAGGGMGYSWWLGLLICVPVVNVGLLLFLLIRPWPVEEELSQRRVEGGAGREGDSRRLIGMAERHLRKGQLREAARLFELVEKQFVGTELSRDAALAGA